ncbi:MAG: S1C family serine protease [Clostridia bacterium]|nr:S1C family serine protease [Clostridia bacterium]
MKRNKILSLVPILGVAVLAAGCSWNSVSVTSIEKTASYTYEDVYTVNFSDGTSSVLTVQHGKDITVQDVYDRFKEEYGDTLSYEEFLEKYLTLTYKPSATVVNECLLSSFEVTTSKYTGSAVLYAINEDKNDAYILTNYHVIYNTGSYGGGSVDSNISCSLFGSEQTSFSCTYMGGSAQSDIALLRANLNEIKAVNEDVRPVTLASGYTVGETVYAIGNSEGLGISATKGIVSVDSEEVQMNVDGKNRTHRVMRIDAAIYHGNSGGGLFNAEGELIGITNGGKETEQSINYAIPVSIVKGTADNILHYYTDGDNSTSGAYKITLGVNVLSQNSRFVYNGGNGYIKEDLVVADSDITTRYSIAYYTLKLQKNDILTGIQINEKSFSLNRAYDIYDALLTARAGDVIKLEYTRSGEQCTTSAYTIKRSDLNAI